jgi:hypothetical protein
MSICRSLEYVDTIQTQIINKKEWKKEPTASVAFRLLANETLKLYSRRSLIMEGSG